MKTGLMVLATAFLLQSASGVFAEETRSGGFLSTLINGDFSGRAGSRVSANEERGTGSFIVSTSERESHQDSSRAESGDRSGTHDSGRESAHDSGRDDNGGNDAGRDSGSNDHDGHDSNDNDD